MADIRIKDLAVTAGSSASDDYLAVDGSTNGTRKLSAYSPTFGGNLTVSGTGVSTFGTTGKTAIQQFSGSGALVAGGWLYGVDEGLNFAPNGAGLNKKLVMANWDGSAYRSVLEYSNVSSGTATLKLSDYGGLTTVGGNLLIGTTTDQGQKLQVNGVIAAGTTTGDRITLSAVSATDQYFLAQNYWNDNGTDNVNTLARGSWRVVMRNAVSNTFNLDWRAASAAAGTFTNLLAIDTSGNATFAGNVTVGNSSVDSGYTLRFTKAISGTFPRTDKIVFGSQELTNGSAAILGVQTAATGATGYLEFHTTDSGTSAERVRLTASGRLRVGQSTDANDARIYSYYPYSASGGNAAIGTEVDQTGALRAIQFANPNGIVGTITTSGSATSFNTSSDRRLKTNIAPAGSASALIDSIQIVQHDWKAGGYVRFGVIAQDIQTVAPEVVFVGDDGEEVKSPWGVDYSKLVPALIKEVQTLRARVAALESV